MERFTIVPIFLLKCSTATQMRIYIRLVFSSLLNKNHKTSTALFRLSNDKCIEHLLELLLKFSIIDFEKAILRAVTDVWQNITIIIGCRHNLSQAWYSQIQALGLSVDYKHRTETVKYLNMCLNRNF